MAADNKSLAQFELTGIPPAPRGVPKIEVAFDLDADGVLTVSARDLGTNREQRIAVTPTSGLSAVEIERIVAESIEHAADDQDRRAIAEARNRGETLLYSSERALAEFGSLLAPDDHQQIADGVAAARAALAVDDVGAIEAAIADLEAVAHRIGEMVYATAADAAPEEA